MEITQIIQTAIELGLLYSLVALSLVISFKVIKFPDLSVDGVFAFGGAIIGVFTTTFDNSFLGLLIAILGGIIAGLITAALNLYLKVNKILSGIVVMISLYSVNLRIMGTSNIPLINYETFLTQFEKSSITLISFLSLVVAIIVLALFLLLKSDIGLYLRAVGINHNVIKDNGKNFKLFVLLGMSISGGIMGLAGGIVALRQGFSDVNMGVGVLIMGLACLYIGDSILKNGKIFLLIFSAIIGTFIYETLISIGLNLGIKPSDLKILTAALVVIAVSIKSRKGDYTIEDII